MARKMFFVVFWSLRFVMEREMTYFCFLIIEVCMAREMTYFGFLIKQCWKHWWLLFGIIFVAWCSVDMIPRLARTSGALLGHAQKKWTTHFLCGLSGLPVAFAGPLEPPGGPQTSHDFKASLRSAPSGLLRQPREAHEIPNFPLERTKPCETPIPSRAHSEEGRISHTITKLTDSSKTIRFGILYIHIFLYFLFV